MMNDDINIKNIENLEKEYKKIKQDLKFINLLINKYDTFFKNINQSQTIEKNKLNEIKNTYKNLKKRQKALYSYLYYINFRIIEKKNKDLQKQNFSNSYDESTINNPNHTPQIDTGEISR